MPAHSSLLVYQQQLSCLALSLEQVQQGDVETAQGPNCPKSSASGCNSSLYSFLMTPSRFTRHTHHGEQPAPDGN